MEPKGSGALAKMVTKKLPEGPQKLKEYSTNMVRNVSAHAWRALCCCKGAKQHILLLLFLQHLCETVIGGL